MVRFEVRGHHRRFMLLKETELHFVIGTRAFPSRYVGTAGRPDRLVGGDMSFVKAQSIGLAIDGPEKFTRAFPKWFNLFRSPVSDQPGGRQIEFFPALTAMGASYPEDRPPGRTPRSEKGTGSARGGVRRVAFGRNAMRPTTGSMSGIPTSPPARN